MRVCCSGGDIVGDAISNVKSMLRIAAILCMEIRQPTAKRFEQKRR